MFLCEKYGKKEKLTGQKYTLKCHAIALFLFVCFPPCFSLSLSAQSLNYIEKNIKFIPIYTGTLESYPFLKAHAHTLCLYDVCVCTRDTHFRNKWAVVHVCCQKE